MFDKDNDDFWNLDRCAKPKANVSQRKQFSKEATSTVEISDAAFHSPNEAYKDIALSSQASEDSKITRFIPPHKDSVYSKKHVLFEYEPKNPLIKSVKIVSDKADDSIFIETNLFIRERKALLKRSAAECKYAPYYSFSPRYSQMSRAQLLWYLWWRENARHGIFLPTDESYIVLYTYELAATEDTEDKQASLNMLCSLLREYYSKNSNITFSMMIRDIICDFCLLHGLNSPIDQLSGIDLAILKSAYLPEFFLDFSVENKDSSIIPLLNCLSMYDYRRSKLYTTENEDIFKNSIDGALLAMINDEAAFNAITSFTDGVYGSVTVEHKPFTRMVNIVNRNIRLEISYYQLSNMHATVTDAVRYSENKLREHLGVKSKLNILAVNPQAKEAIDRFFSINYPAMSIPDRRRRSAKEKEAEIHEYDKLYDVPKVEISPEHALEIERDSWSTTKILTEAFADNSEETNIGSTPDTEDVKVNAVPYFDNSIPVTEQSIELNVEAEKSSNTQSSLSLKSQISDRIDDLSEFIELCFDSSAMEQRRFALSHKLSADEIADRINEAAVEIFGDIVIENNGEAYRIIDDYKDMFE